MEPFGREAESVDVGQRLRILREERGISMRALARRSGLSANALSMIERGLTSPSVSTLNKLATALEVPITAFFRQEPQREQIVYRKASERSRVPFMRGLIEGLGGEGFVGRVEAFLLTLESGGSSGPHGMIHSGQELVFCIRGVLEYEVEDQRFTLEAGDSLIFSAQLIHRWRNSGSSVANAIIVISAFEESERPGEFHLASMLSGEARQAGVGNNGDSDMPHDDGDGPLSDEV
jgi:quercetin dioxygenase-like cupin family protein/lambda repressor-like predicted transcriptional regulator